MKFTVTNEYDITSYGGEADINWANDLEFSIWYDVTPTMPSPARSFVWNVLQKNKEILTMFARELYTYIEAQLPNMKKGRHKPHALLKDDIFYIRAISRWRLEVTFETKPNFILPTEETFINAFLEGVGHEE